VPLATATLVSFAVAAQARDELRAIWEAYAAEYISADGRVIDYRNAATSTSEGQSYALVRALWMEDRGTFDRVLAWTAANLQKGDPGALPAWKWGDAGGGEWRVLDAAPASDADQLMIWALLGATRKWDEPAYASQARILLDRLWAEEVEVLGGGPVVLPGPWAKDKEVVRLNPSYFLPFVWRDLAEFDPDRPWAAVIDRAYELLAVCRGSAGLAMDWCYIERATGALRPPAEAGHDGFGFEAMRVPWMLAAEVQWHDERRASALLPPYVRLMARRGDCTRVAGVLREDGTPDVDWEYPGMYGALFPAWSLRRPAAAARFREARLDPLRAAHGWGDRDDYYGQNWLWFGLALADLREKPA
jgi:endoglucanase